MNPAAEGGTLKVLRLGNRWDLAFHQNLKRDAKGDVFIADGKFAAGDEVHFASLTES